MVDYARYVMAGALCACALLGAPNRTLAGAWTQPQGSGLMIDTLFGWSGEGAPWGGGKGVDQTRLDAQTYLEYGLTDDWTIFGQMAIERYDLGPPTPNVYTRSRLFGHRAQAPALVDRPMGFLRRRRRSFCRARTTRPLQPRPATPAGQGRRVCWRERISRSAPGRGSLTPSSAIACAPPARPTNGMAI